MNATFIKTLIFFSVCGDDHFMPNIYSASDQNSLVLHLQDQINRILEHPVEIMMANINSITEIQLLNCFKAKSDTLILPSKLLDFSFSETTAAVVQRNFSDLSKIQESWITTRICKRE